MIDAGAVKLRKAIQQLEKRKALPLVSVSQESPDLLKIEKRTESSASRIEFYFLIRVKRSNSSEVWWPIEYGSASGETISCETRVNDKVLVNLAKQDKLIALAETWAKSLEAQKIVWTIESALL